MHGIILCKPYYVIYNMLIILRLLYYVYNIMFSRGHLPSALLYLTGHNRLCIGAAVDKVVETAAL